MHNLRIYFTGTTPIPQREWVRQVVPEHKVGLSDFRLAVVATSKKEAVEILMAAGMVDHTALQLGNGLRWLNGPFPTWVRALANEKIFDSKGIRVWHKEQEGAKVAKVEMVDGEPKVEIVAILRQYPGASGLTIETPNADGGRIQWKYSRGSYGYGGHVSGLRIFSMASSTDPRDRGDYTARVLESTLPGYEHKKWRCKDEGAAKKKAEELLDLFVQRITYQP
jgi:hypothetical protein